MKYIVIDTETTGLKPDIHEMISLGAIVMINDIITERFEVKVKPRRLEQADPRAMQVNGYDEYKWRKGTRITKMVKIICKKDQEEKLVPRYYTVFNAEQVAPIEEAAAAK